MTQPRHIPVLPRETIDALSPRPGETYADATAGLGGHAALIAESVGPTGHIILNDADPANLTFAQSRLAPTGCSVTALHGNFADLPRKLAAQNLVADMLLADLGFSSNQMESPERGLSFMRDGPLDMRLDPTLPVTAAELVNSLPERDLAQLIFEFGEDPASRRIARKLVQARESEPITTTAKLASLIRSAVGPAACHGPTDPSTRTFQALRISVNDEMGSLDALLQSISRAAESLVQGRDSWLRVGSRIATLTFHSLEDRRVKRVFTDLVKQGLATEIIRGVTPPSEDEVRANPRSRSAKLRAIRIGS